MKDDYPPTREVFAFVFFYFLLLTGFGLAIEYL